VSKVSQVFNITYVFHKYVFAEKILFVYCWMFPKLYH